jgi:hypothetical protein
MAVCATGLLHNTALARDESDLDRFMAQVLARRDENWRRLQQYVLDERETAELVGPDGSRLFGIDREYTWYIRDGLFVRSPVRYNGVALTDTERRAHEREWLERERHRDQKGQVAAPGPSDSTGSGEIAQIVELTREPRFVSAAYFLKFRFEPGRYALVGRESYEGKPVYRIEYYPTRLYDEGSASEPAHAEKEEARITRQMNKVALITLWVEPELHQIVQYTFDNVGFEFLPGRSLFRVDEARASMRMGEAFPGVWLPQMIDGRGTFSLATGSFTGRYATRFFNYREANVKARVR